MTALDADFGETLKRLAAGEALTAAEAAKAFTAIMAGAVSPVRVAAFLTAIAVRGPTVDEITGGARTLRLQALAVEAPEGAMDVCGTGGDGQGTFNISTAAAFIVAGCGVPVAKHGNRAMSSRTGTADVLEALGVRIGLSPEGVAHCLKEANIGFMFAQTHHPAMKHVAPVRQELGFRTIFNLLGPLANPARVKRQLLGVYSAEWVEPIAKALQALGAVRAWVVSGGDGLDEITTTTTTTVAALENGKIRRLEIGPEDAGIERTGSSALKGGDAGENAEAIRALLKGAKGAFRDIAMLNAAAALIVAEKAGDLREGARLAAACIDEGGAYDALEALIAASREAAP